MRSFQATSRLHQLSISSGACKIARCGVICNFQNERCYSHVSTSLESLLVADDLHSTQNPLVLGRYGQPTYASASKIGVVSMYGKDRISASSLLVTTELARSTKLTRTSVHSRRRLRQPVDVLLRHHPVYMKQTGGNVYLDGGSDKKPVNEREVNIGKTIDILRKKLPCLLHSPLPTEILSQSITLHLFPSTHPHLPTVRGRVAYVAALWSAPVAWGRLPGLKLHLEILNERFTKSITPGNEKLVIKWRACSSIPSDHPPSSPGLFSSSTLFTSLMAPTKSNTSSQTSSTETQSNSPLQESKKEQVSYEYDNQFCGLFIFEFDANGRIGKHTIENVEENTNQEKQSRVIAVTEWLLRKAKGTPDEKAIPSLAFLKAHDNQRRTMS